MTHYVVVGLARSRQQWFGELARWATMAVAPIEYVKCLSGAEVLATLGSGRRVSVLLVDAGSPELDRELLADAAAASVPCVVVEDGHTRRDWESLGAVAVLPDDFDRDALVRTLEAHGRPVDRAARRPARARVATDPALDRRAIVVSVVSGGGAGGSTVALAVAQALAEVRVPGSVAAVDGARRADLGMLVDVGDVIPGLPDLVEAHRHDEPDPEVVRSLLYRIAGRGHDLLLGGRRAHDWTAMPARSVRAALEGLCRTYEVVVVDHDRDLDGEEETGSVDVEDRHAVARWAVERADVVLAVGGGTEAQQLHDLVRLLDELHAAGVPPLRIRPVVNRAPAAPLRRRAVATAIPALARAEVGRRSPAPPTFLPRLRRLGSCQHHDHRLPRALCVPLGELVRRTLAEQGPRDAGPVEPAVAIEPGELGLHDEPVRFGTRSGAA
jgi:hypothetical protein